MASTPLFSRVVVRVEATTRRAVFLRIWQILFVLVNFPLYVECWCMLLSEVA